VILMSGAHDPGSAEPVFDAQLDKPFRARDLASTIRSVLDGSSRRGSATPLRP
jgi:hypothetical protein